MPRSAPATAASGVAEASTPFVIDIPTHLQEAWAPHRPARPQKSEGGKRFDVILSDLMMPDMTGMDLHAVLTRAYPDQAGNMIFMTGGAFSPESEAFLAGVSNRTLEKPFKPAALRDRVQGLLQQAREPR